ncbi:toll/interleukin-1 receptor domain-containing protein [Nitrosomonas communis]|uniref:TIR domain-containing protein n=1 Tax=Nitrosomonas communis TaxID=44574 RepID=A0A1I4M595_9PROT|nr:toll/interleukin-1 receptor domain-containing protein [Nitrosomonas communis]SFL98293.1 TIR domain-containing protein [Nitrosomonas communis]
MNKSQGFWSYVHADDEADGQRIARLAWDVSAQFEMLTGESLEIFLDKDAIRWGEEWRNKIDANLATIAFFIPVLTPRYFMSAECRRELQFFAREANRLGIRDLLLPVLYVDVSALHEENPTDDLILLIRSFQWEDWRDLRFVDVSAEAYRRGVAKLAVRLVEANRYVEKSNAASTRAIVSTNFPGEELNEPPGFLDQMARTEDTLPKLAHTMESIAREIEQIGRIMRKGTSEIAQRDKQAAGFAARLVVTKKVAQLLSEPVERIWSFGNEFTSHLHDVDQGVRLLIEQSVEELDRVPSAKPMVCSFFVAIRTMSKTTEAGLASVQGMIDAIGPLEKMSRDLRPVLRQLRNGLTTMVEAREVSAEWVELIARTGIDCTTEELPEGSAQHPLAADGAGSEIYGVRPYN